MLYSEMPSLYLMLLCSISYKQDKRLTFFRANLFRSIFREKSSPKKDFSLRKHILNINLSRALLRYYLFLPVLHVG